MSQSFLKNYQNDNSNSFNQFGSNDNYNHSHTMNSMQYNMGASSSAFPSRRVNTKFEWKQLMKLNPNYIQSSGDVSSLEPYIGNLLSSSITEEELQMLPEGYVVTLIKLLQLVGENLINIQQRLECDNKALEDKTMKMSQLLPKTTTKSQDHIRIIKKLKQEIKEKDLLIQTYQRIIQNDKGMNTNSKIINFNQGNEDNNDNEFQMNDNENRQRFFCQFCSGKKFSSEVHLEDHMRRRHLIKSEVIPNQTKGENIESKLNELKNHFDTLLRNTQMQSEYQRLNDKLNTIENAIQGNNVDMMNTFNMNLMNQSRMTNQPQLNNTQRQSMIQPLLKTNFVSPNNDSSNILKETMNKINDKIERNNKENGAKFQNILDEMKRMKMSVSNDLSHIKQKQSYNRANERMNTSPLKTVQLDNPQGQNVILTKPQEVNIINENDSKLYNQMEPMIREKPQPKLYVNTIDNNPTPQSQDNANTNNITKKTVPVVQQQTNANLSIITQKRNEANPNFMKNSKAIEKSKIDIELDAFFNKFTERDNKFQNGTLKVYTTELIQPDFVNHLNTSKIIESHIQKTLFAMGNNQRITLNSLNKEDLMQLINNCCQDLSEKGDEIDANNLPSIYGYYKHNIDSLLQLEQTIEWGQNIFIQSKVHEKQRIESKRITSSILQSQNRSSINNLGIRLDQDKGNDDNQIDSPRFNLSSNLDKSSIDKRRIATASEVIDYEFERNY